MADYSDTIDLATRIHADLPDKAGKPYIEHLSRVAEAVLAADGSEAQVVAAYLHDAIEDTPETAQSLRASGVKAGRKVHHFDRLKSAPPSGSESPV